VRAPQNTGGLRLPFGIASIRCMKLLAVLLFCLSCAYPQSKVTVTGCVDPGVECLRLKNLKGKQDYSLAKTDKLQVGHAYRIKGVVSDFGFCQEGKPILAPEKIIELKNHSCQPPPNAP
jgi:hypothetical protein